MCLVKCVNLNFPTGFLGFLRSRRDRKKEKDNKKVSKKKRDSDASSVKSEGEPSGGTLGGSSGISVGGSGGDSSRDKDLFAPQQQQLRTDDFLVSTATGIEATASALAAPLTSSIASSSDGVRVDEEGYTIRPKDEAWSTNEKTSGFYSSSDADSGKFE